MCYLICFSCVFRPIGHNCAHSMLYSCITATSQSYTSYTAVYAGVGTFVVTALMGVIIDYFDSNVISNVIDYIYKVIVM